MTVRELVGRLSELDPDALVVLSCDAEGNRDSPLRGVFAGTYVAETAVAGTFLHPEDVLWWVANHGSAVAGIAAIRLVPSN